MALSHDPGLQVYVSKKDIPFCQRDAVWGLAAIAVFICGLLVGWLVLSAMLGRSGQRDAALAQQQAVNQTLQDDIAQLEAVLADDVCSLEAVNRVSAIAESAGRP